MNQDQPAEHFADRERTLLTVSDPGVRNSGLMKAKEVRVLRDKYSPGLGGEGQLVLVAHACEASVSRPGHIDSSPPQTGCHREGNVLIQVKADAHRQEASSSLRLLTFAAKAEEL